MSSEIRIESQLVRRAKRGNKHRGAKDAYRGVWSGLNLLRETHQQDLGARISPAVLQVFLSLGTDRIVGRL
jgi:hypothetical protein